MALKQFYIKNVGPAKIQRVQQKIPECWTYVQQNENWRSIRALLCNKPSILYQWK
jgi:hypothetical protein